MPRLKCLISNASSIRATRTTASRSWRLLASIDPWLALAVPAVCLGLVGGRAAAQSSATPLSAILSGSPLPINYTWDTSDHEQFSEEITLSGNAFQKLDWTVGGFYYNARDSNQGFSSWAESRLAALSARASTRVSHPTPIRWLAFLEALR